MEQSKIIDTLETYHPTPHLSRVPLGADSTSTGDCGKNQGNRVSITSKGKSEESPSLDFYSMSLSRGKAVSVDCTCRMPE
jgi:hypothetical protein